MTLPLAVVVVGGSAGGIDAVSDLLAPLPAGFPAPIAIVLHLPAGQPSLLTGIFGARCRLAVREASDKEPLTPATVFVAPPDYHLLLESGGTIALSADPPWNFSRPSIDLLFESAAWGFGAGVLGIVLSGANDDGAAGLGAIRRAGGLGWVQAPDDAAIPTMPQAAIESAAPDLVLPAAALGERLALYASRGAR